MTQELPALRRQLENWHGPSDSGSGSAEPEDSLPGVASVLDDARSVFRLLRHMSSAADQRQFSRLHLHTLAFQVISGDDEDVMMVRRRGRMMGRRRRMTGRRRRMTIRRRRRKMRRKMRMNVMRRKRRRLMIRMRKMRMMMMGRRRRLMMRMRRGIMGRRRRLMMRSRRSKMPYL